jgi:hypothetical protein
MNRSFTKIRHIQEVNRRLEKTSLKEQNESFQDEELQRIIDLDEELENDLNYKKYEKIYSINKIKRLISSQMGTDMSDMDDEESLALIDMFTTFMDAGKESRHKMTRENILERKDSVIDTVIEIIEVAVENGDFEMVSKLKKYIRLLEDYK